MLLFYLLELANARPIARANPIDIVLYDIENKARENSMNNAIVRTLEYVLFIVFTFRASLSNAIKYDIYMQMPNNP